MTISFEDVTGQLVMPPQERDGVCASCRSWAPHDAVICRNCHEAQMQLDDISTVLPITLYTKPSPLRDWLTFYKPGRETYEPEFGRILVYLIDKFMTTWKRQLEESFGAFDGVAVVPSTKVGGDTFADLVRELTSIPFGASNPLSYGGAEESAHNKYSTTLFEASADVQDKQFLILDDVYTTGARAQSAAHAIRRQGGGVTAIVPIARRVNPDYCPEAERLWSMQSRLKYHFGGDPYWISSQS